MAFLFEKLNVYQKVLDFADEINNISQAFPKGSWYFVDQLSRASVSISVNIAEGNGRFHKNDGFHFFRIARGSAFECVPLLELCKRRKWLVDNDYQRLRDKLIEISKMLSGLAKD